MHSSRSGGWSEDSIDTMLSARPVMCIWHVAEEKFQRAWETDPMCTACRHWCVWLAWPVGGARAFCSVGMGPPCNCGSNGEKQQFALGLPCELLLGLGAATAWVVCSIMTQNQETGGLGLRRSGRALCVRGQEENARVRTEWRYAVSNAYLQIPRRTKSSLAAGGMAAFPSSSVILTINYARPEDGTPRLLCVEYMDYTIHKLSGGVQV